jgi:hypothetical protein
LLGDVFMAQGDLAEALVSSQDSLATRDRLANTNPDSASSQHDLSKTQNNNPHQQQPHPTDGVTPDWTRNGSAILL